VRHPELVSRIGVAGHEVGNHYFRNGSTLLHSDAQFVAYLEKTERAMGMTAVRKLFRPPGGVAWPRQLRPARAKGYECVLGYAYPHDPMRVPACYIKRLTLTSSSPLMARTLTAKPRDSHGRFGGFLLHRSA
jgi:peptidoglycan/xylan/chitin deacetylase (PgdA/CDA1 family)